jgi:hypothetical protein
MKYKTGLVGLAVLGLISCTSLSEGEEGVAGVEQDERVQYNGNADATIRDMMDEQASDINRKKNIEESDRTDPGMKPPEVRTERLKNSPRDTTKHNQRRVLQKSGN